MGWTEKFSARLMLGFTLKKEEAEKIVIFLKIDPFYYGRGSKVEIHLDEIKVFIAGDEKGHTGETVLRFLKAIAAASVEYDISSRDGGANGYYYTTPMTDEEYEEYKKHLPPEMQILLHKIRCRRDRYLKAKSEGGEHE